MNDYRQQPDTIDELFELMARRRAFQPECAEAVPEPGGGAIAFLNQCGYLAPRLIEGRRWAAIRPLMYTFAILVGKTDELAVGYDERWCYERLADALVAFDAWDGKVGTEPVGWIRHPTTGRRRPDGDASREYVDF